MFFAAALASCSENDPNTSSSDSAAQTGDLVAINTYAGTTKATDTTTESLETSAKVILHIDDSDSVQATYTFEYDGSDWSQSGSSLISWGTIEFPANFYSMHDGDDPLGSLSFTSDVATYTAYTVTGESTEHKDLVYHASKLTAIPTGGAVSVYHKHALSKLHLYAATGTNNVYIARVNLVNIDAQGTATITPIAYDQISTANDIGWVNSKSDFETYLYFYLDGAVATGITSASGTDPIINSSPNAPLMIIPQTTTAAEVTGSSDSVAKFSGSYVEVIYYMTDSNNMPLVGYSSVEARSDADKYIGTDQDKVLYVMGAFPLGYTFEANKEYNIALGLGADNSSGGILIADYFVDQDGVAVDLTLADGTDDGKTVPIPQIDEGDDILAGSGDSIDILVTATSWDDGDTVKVEYTVDE